MHVFEDIVCPSDFRWARKTFVQYCLCAFARVRKYDKKYKMNIFWLPSYAGFVHVFSNFTRLLKRWSSELNCAKTKCSELTETLTTLEQWVKRERSLCKQKNQGKRKKISRAERKRTLGKKYRIKFIFYLLLLYGFPFLISLLFCCMISVFLRLSGVQDEREIHVPDFQHISSLTIAVSVAQAFHHSYSSHTLFSPSRCRYAFLAHPLTQALLLFLIFSQFGCVAAPRSRSLMFLLSLCISQPVKLEIFVCDWFW